MKNNKTNAKFIYEAIILLLVAVVAIFNLKYANEPLLGLHSFRQTQTAITAYWFDFHNILNSIFSYETPILGCPWSVPFEFPIFQMIVAGFHGISRIPLDLSGRLLSFLFFLVCFFPLSEIIKELKIDREYFYISTILILLSPCYLYWSRAFMIESTALLAGFLFLWSSVRYFKTFSWKWYFWTLLFGMLCTLIKITTFPSFAISAIFLSCLLLSNTKKKFNFRNVLIKTIPIGVIFFICLICLMWWTHHADCLKQSNRIANFLTSKNLEVWSFGTFSQRVSYYFWADVLWKRILTHALGFSYSILIILVGFLYCKKNQSYFMLGLLVLFFIPMLIFTNLHIIHDYYQYANDIWLILCLSYALYSIQLKSDSKINFYLFILFFGFVISSDCVVFYRDYYKSIIEVEHNGDKDPRLEISHKIQAVTPVDSVVIIIGQDWSPEIPYYSQRKAVLVPNWLTFEQASSILDDKKIYGNITVAAIVSNTNTGGNTAKNDQILKHLLNTYHNFDLVFTSGGMNLYSYRKSL
ncbi:MAG: glycosyltransferase family 39 protein [Chthoniobacterales bacterium]|nr:glycosyltransferase family 39 protein [Chthoniobacterales bacterium]